MAGAIASVVQVTVRSPLDFTLGIGRDLGQAERVQDIRDAEEDTKGQLTDEFGRHLRSRRRGRTAALNAESVEPVGG